MSKLMLKKKAMQSFVHNAFYLYKEHNLLHCNKALALLHAQKVLNFKFLWAPLGDTYAPLMENFSGLLGTLTSRMFNVS